MLHQSLATGIVPIRWKTVVITPLAKVPRPTKPSDYRPISVTPVLSRLLEKLIAPALLNESTHLNTLRQPSSALNFEDQFAFRSSGWTDTAVITLLHTVLSMLTTSTSLRSTSPLLRIRWRLCIYDFFRDQQHCTRYAGQSSSVTALRPASFRVPVSARRRTSSRLQTSIPLRMEIDLSCSPTTRT